MQHKEILRRNYKNVLLLIEEKPQVLDKYFRKRSHQKQSGNVVVGSQCSTPCQHGHIDFAFYLIKMRPHLPNISQKERLKAMGLGELKITFDDIKGNHQFLTRVLEEKIPLLKEAGGYSICRTATGSQRLQVITPGKNGYSIPYLRDESPLRQEVAYIRPLQKSIFTYTPQVEDK